jgi:hypothetical protein
MKIDDNVSVFHLFFVNFFVKKPSNNDIPITIGENNNTRNQEGSIIVGVWSIVSIAKPSEIRPIVIMINYI